MEQQSVGVAYLGELLGHRDAGGISIAHATLTPCPESLTPCSHHSAAWRPGVSAKSKESSRKY